MIRKYVTRHFCRPMQWIDRDFHNSLGFFRKNQNSSAKGSSIMRVLKIHRCIDGGKEALLSIES